MKTNNRKVVVCPSPFKTERIFKYLPDSLTVAEMAEVTFSDKRGKALLKHDLVVCCIGETPIKKDYWHCVKAKKGTIVSFKVVLKGGGGGGGKNIVTTIATIALVAVAAWAGYAAFALAGGKTAAAGSLASAKAFAAMAAASATVMTAGTLLLNSLIPPQTAKMNNLSSGETTSPTLSLTGASNKANPYGKSPVVYGTFRFHPPLAALPYTETCGEDQYMRLLFDCGIGPLNLTDFKIGTTDLDKYEDVELEIRNGYPDDTPLTLFSSSVIQDDYSAVELLYNTPIERTTREDVDEAVVDISFNGLVTFSSNGARQNREVKIKYEYRKNGSTGAWTAVGSTARTDTETKTTLTRIAGTAADNLQDFRTAANVQSIVSLSLECQYPFLEKEYKVYYRKTGDASWILGGSGKATRYQYGSEYPVWREKPYKLNLVLPLGFQYDIRVQRTNAVKSGVITNGFLEPAASYKVHKTVYSLGEVTYVAATEQLVRKTLRIKFPAVGTYDIRVTRITQDTDSELIRDKSFMSNIKSIRADYPINVTNHALIAMRIKANGQLNGIVDSFNVLASRLLPIYDPLTEAWSEPTATSNPAWIFCSIFCGEEAGQKKLDHSVLDLTSIVDWATACEQDPPHTELPDGIVSQNPLHRYWEFNAVIDYETTKFELARDVCAVGRARVATPSLKLGVIRDKLQTEPVQLFSPRNSRGFSGTRRLAKIPHALRVRFVDESQDYQKQGEVVVYRDGYTSANSTLFETLELAGCTSNAQAWREGRYHLAVMQHRLDTYTLETGIDNLRCTEGDLVAVCHDVPSWGLGFARIKNLVLNEAETHIIEIVLDDLIIMENGKSYAIQVRKQDGSISQYLPDTVNGQNYTLYFDTNPIEVEEELNIKDLVLLGLLESAYVELVIKQIEYDFDLNASIRFYDAAPEIHEADQIALPAYDPQRTPDPVLVGPDPAVGLASTTSVRIIDGIYVYDEIITYAPAERSPVSAYEIYQFTGDTWKFITLTTDTSYRFSKVNPLEEFKVAVVTMGITGKKLAIEESAQLEKTIDLIEPADVTGFNLQVAQGQASALWNLPADGARVTWQIRFSETVSTWEDATTIVSGALSPGVAAPARVGFYYIKAIDFYGIASENAAILYNATIGYTSMNVIEQYEESPTWIGTKEDLAVVDECLQLTTGLFDDAGGLFDDGIGLFDGGLGTSASEGYYYLDMDGNEYLDLGAVYVSRCLHNLIFDELINTDPAQENQIQVEVQVSYTLDDPVDSGAEWSNWETFNAGDYEARAFKFRIVLRSLNGYNTPRIKTADIIVDMPDRTEYGSGISDPAGTTINFTEFKFIKMRLCGAKGLSTGDYWERTDETLSSFKIRFFDSTGTGVARNFDYTVIGYGKVST